MVLYVAAVALVVDDVHRRGRHGTEEGEDGEDEEDEEDEGEEEEEVVVVVVAVVVVVEEEDGRHGRRDRRGGQSCRRVAVIVCDFRGQTQMGRQYHQEKRGRVQPRNQTSGRMHLTELEDHRSAHPDPVESMSRALDLSYTLVCGEDGAENEREAGR